MLGSAAWLGRPWVTLAWLTLAGAAPWMLTDPYQRGLLVVSLIFAILAVGLNLMFGYLGELSMAHAAFFGIGAYTSALLTLRLGWQVPLALVAAVAVTAVLGLGMGWIALRITGPYFAIVTLGFGEILHIVVLNAVEVTNGPMGLSRIPQPGLRLSPTIGFEVSDEIGSYYYTLLLLLGAVYVSTRLVHSRFGRAVIAIRGNEHLAASLGVDVQWFKRTAFVVASAIAGLAGAAYVHYIRFASPDLLGLYYLVNAMVIVILGGPGTMGGPIVGAFLFVFLPEYLRLATSLRLVIFGCLLVASIIFLPRGIWPEVQALVRRLFLAARAGAVRRAPTVSPIPAAHDE